MRLVIGFNGHSQRSKTTTGVGQVLGEIERRRPDIETRLFAWRVNTKVIARWIAGLRLERLDIIGYSYGGYSAVLLCRELRALGVAVNHLWTIDAVFRIWDHWGSLRSLRDYWIIAVPQNVRVVTSWRQKVNKPRGHWICTYKTTTHDARSLNVRHAEADDSPIVQAAILDRVCS